MSQSWPTTFPIAGTRLISAFRGDFNDIIQSLVTVFMGASDPSVTFPGQLWGDTTENKLKQRNVADTGWNVLADLGVDYGGALPKSGGTMSGAINMGGYGITNLPAGSGSAPARYTDLAAYVKADGSVPFTDHPTFPSANPTVSTDGAHKGYVDATVLGGGTYTGQITMTVAPTADQHVMRKSDVTNVIDTHTHSGVAGMGPKVPGANISSPPGSNGYVLKANASQGASFAQLTAGVYVPTTEQTLIATVYQSDSWQTMDIAAYVPTDTQAVIVWCVQTETAYGWSVNFRKYGSGATTGHQYWGCLGGTSFATRYTTIVPVASQNFDIKAVRPTGGGQLQIYMIGYLRSNI